MKKKILVLLFIIPLFGISLVNAQCTPDPIYTSTGLYPADSLPHADVGTSYSTIMTIVIPADTNLMGFPVTIDSVGITNINGLPASLTYQTDATNDYWPGGTSGCILISGTPIPADAGIDTLTFNMQYYLQGTQIPDSLQVRILRIQGTVGIGIIIPDKFNVLQNLPNPFSDKTKIVYTTPVNDSFDFTVYNIIGDVVYKKSLKAKAGTNNIIFDADGLTSGIYLYKISNENQVITKRMIISE